MTEDKQERLRQLEKEYESCTNEIDDIEDEIGELDLRRTLLEEEEVELWHKIKELKKEIENEAGKM